MCRLNLWNHLCRAKLHLIVVIVIIKLVQIFLKHLTSIDWSSIKVNILVRCKVCYWLLHIVIVNYLWLPLKLMNLCKWIYLNGKLIRHLRMSHLLHLMPTFYLILKKNLLLCSALPSTFLFWYLLCFYFLVFHGRGF